MELFIEIFLLIVLSVITLVYLVHKMNTRSSRKCPPSLPWLPIVGSLPFLSEIGTLHLCLTEKTKRYGNVYSFYAGHSKQVVVLSGHDAIREALVKRSVDFAGKEMMYAERTVWNKGEGGLAFRQYNGYYKMLRNTSIAVLKKFGFGVHATMEAKIHEEIHEFIKYINTKKGEAFDMAKIQRMSTLNIIYSLMLGKRFKSDEAIGEYIAKKILMHIESLNPIFDLFPITRYISPFTKKLKALIPRAEKYQKVIQDKIDECLNSPDEEDNFVKEFIKTAGSTFNQSELYLVINDLLGGGMDTGSTLILWAVLLMCNHPLIQERLHNEIDMVVPKKRLPSIPDKLPYLEATLLEILRIKTLLPLAIPHFTTCNTEVAGFFIPVNTQVIVNIWSAHMDTNVWVEPDQFLPERFLNDKNELINRDLMIAFSFGKRSCPGKVLGRQESFLYLGALLQQFNILPPDGQTRIPD